jgi:hypothetical protein
VDARHRFTLSLAAHLAPRRLYRVEIYFIVDWTLKRQMFNYSGSQKNCDGLLLCESQVILRRYCMRCQFRCCGLRRQGARPAKCIGTTLPRLPHSDLFTHSLCCAGPSVLTYHFPFSLVQLHQGAFQLWCCCFMFRVPD